jgi:selenocysteine lyase/cysteine desulfurase
MDVLATAGVERIGAHVLALTDRLVEGLASRGYLVSADRSSEEVKSGIVTFTRDGLDAIALGKRLGEAHICTTYRRDGIRIAPHGYNTPEEIDAILEILPRFSR